MQILFYPITQESRKWWNGYFDTHQRDLLRHSQDGDLVGFRNGSKNVDTFGLIEQNVAFYVDYDQFDMTFSIEPPEVS